jgi:hypothetical protein
LIAFLKKIKVVDKSVILEMDGSQLFAKVRTTDKSVIKYVAIDTYQFLDGDIPKNRIKIGMMEINKIMDAFKYFGPEEETFMEIVAQPVDKDIVATGLRIFSKSLNITLRCADINLVTYMDDGIQQMIHNPEGHLVSFQVPKSNFTKIVSLVGMENNSEELLNFDVYSNRIKVRGNSFDYVLVDDTEIPGYEEDQSYTIYKNQFSNIDQEDSMFYVQENRIIVISQESESKIAIGRVEME